MPGAKSSEGVSATITRVWLARVLRLTVATATADPTPAVVEQEPQISLTFVRRACTSATRAHIETPCAAA